MALQRLFPPLAGVSEDQGYTDQEPMTARDAENVVSLEPSTGRTRLTKRPGLSKFCSSKMGTGKVRDLTQLVYNNLKIDYATLAAPVEDWVAAANSTYGYIGCAVSPRGDIFVAGRYENNAVYQYNGDGQLVSTIEIKQEGVTSGYSPTLGDVRWEIIEAGEYDDFFIGCNYAVSGAGVMRLARFTLQGDGTYAKAWSLNALSASPDNMTFVRGICYKNQRLYVLGQSAISGTPNVTIRTFDNVLGTVKPELKSIFVVATGTAGQVAGGIDVDDDGNIYVSYAVNTGVVGTSTNTITKLSPNHAVLWTSSYGGTGMGCRWADGYVATVGFPTGATASATTWARLYTDAGVVQWSKTTAVVGFPDIPGIRPQIDGYGNVHLPLPVVASGAEKEYQLYNRAGTSLITADLSVPLSAIALPASNPDYTYSAVPPNHPEFIYAVAYANNLYQYRLVERDVLSGSARTFVQLAVVDNDIVTFTSAGIGTPTDSTDTMSSTSDYAQSTCAFGKAYFADGDTYRVYDPVANAVDPYISNTSGLIPKKCRLIESWRSRIVLAGDPDNRHAIYWSAHAKPQDWDFYPPQANSKQAIWTGIAPQLGDLPDIINCVVPYSNDWMLAGCDHSIYLLRGDPAAGGTWDLITNQGGMAWGRPYCFGPDGELYYFATQGGVYVMAPGLSTPQRLTAGRLERQLADVDLGTHYPRLAWDHRQQGLIVLLCPFGAGGTSVRGWFWSQKHAAWWPIRFGSSTVTGVQPTAVFTSDADDPADRVVLFGCEDSYVRRLDETISYDETTGGTQLGISSYVLMGPFMTAERTQRVKVRSIWATMASAGQCIWQVFTQGRPDGTLTTPAAYGTLRPGYNARIPVRKKGPTVYLRLTDAGPSVPWCIESLALDLEVGDRERRKL